MTTEPTHLTAVLGRYDCLGPYNDHDTWSARWPVTFDESFTAVRHAFGEAILGDRLDICELSFGAYLQARELGRPITLLPITLASRFQHAELVAPAGAHGDGDWLHGKRVGLMYYGQTTGTWIRAILKQQRGVDLDQIEWVEAEPPPIPYLAEPANVSAAPGADLSALLDAGEIDAMIGKYSGRSQLTSVIEDPAGTAREWYETTGIQTINHGLVIREDRLVDYEQVLLEIHQTLRQLIDDCRPEPNPAAEWAWQREVNLFPTGYSAMYPSLRRLADESFEQHVLSRPLADDELVHPLVSAWD